MTTPAPTPAPVPGRPTVPRARFGKLAIAMAIIGTTVVGGYAAAAYTDYEPGSPERDQIPASVRNSPGGYRSLHVWHSGYHGGK